MSMQNGALNFSRWRKRTGTQQDRNLKWKIVQDSDNAFEFISESLIRVYFAPIYMAVSGIKNVSKYSETSI